MDGAAGVHLVLLTDGTLATPPLRGIRSALREEAGACWRIASDRYAEWTWHRITVTAAEQSVPIGRRKHQRLYNILLGTIWKIVSAIRIDADKRSSSYHCKSCTFLLLQFFPLIEKHTSYITAVPISLTLHNHIYDSHVMHPFNFLILFVPSPNLFASFSFNLFPNSFPNP